MIVVSGCLPPFGESDPVVARVRFKKLRVSDIENKLGANPEIQLREQFIDNWVDQQLWFIEAKKIVRLNKEERQQVNDYRSSLIIRKYRDQYLLGSIMITENDVLQYYEDHHSEFITDVDAAFVELYVCRSSDIAKEVISSLESSEQPLLSPNFKLVKKNMCVDPLDRAIFNDKNKQTLIGPVSHNKDHYVVFVIERYKKGSRLRVEHVRDDIIQRLKITRYSNVLQQKQKELKDRINVKIK